MYQHKVLTLFLVAGVTLSAQTINLSGKVSSQTGKAISGAVVTLVSKKVSDTTDAAGMYSISGGVASVNSFAGRPESRAIVLNNGSITLRLATEEPVRIELFDLQGNLREKVLDKSLKAGDFRCDIAGNPRAASMMVIRVSIGEKSMSFRYLPLSNSNHSVNISSSGVKESRLSKIQASAVDTLKVSASGFTTKKVVITSLQGKTDIVLDTVPASSGNCTASKKVNTTVSGSGPHKVVIETNSDAGINKGTIFRPEDLGGDEKYPIFLWGEGGCSQNGLSNKAAMGEIASWGYFVVADGTPSSGAAKTSSSNMGDPKQFYGYLDWVFAQNRNSCSAYYQKLDTTKVAADGFSCGGLMSINASGDPRFTAIGYTSSGLFSADQALYKKIHTAIKILNGGPESAGNDMAYENGVRDFADMSKVGISVLYYVKTSAGHGGDLNSAKGDFNTINLAWLNWQLKGDTGATGKALLIGADCKFCKNSGWEFKTANLE